jgi:hypothetical protein
MRILTPDNKRESDTDNWKFVFPETTKRIPRHPRSMGGLRLFPPLINSSVNARVVRVWFTTPRFPGCLCPFFTNGGSGRANKTRQSEPPTTGGGTGETGKEHLSVRIPAATERIAKHADAVTQVMVYTRFAGLLCLYGVRGNLMGVYRGLQVPRVMPDRGRFGVRGVGKGRAHKDKKRANSEEHYKQKKA